MPKIKFDNNGFVYIEVFIKSRSTPAMLGFDYKVDTGANRTTISRNKLNDLGFDDNWIASGKLLTGNDRPTVATGEPIDDCYIVALPELNIGGYIGYNWPFLTSLSAKFRFLIGTDTMRFFNWEFDYMHNICRYKLIAGKREILFNQKEQSIHTVDDINIS